MTRTTTRAAVVTTAGLLALAACAGSDGADGPGDAPSASPSATSASSAPSEDPPTDDASSDDTSADDAPLPDAATPAHADPGADAALVVTDVRVARHDGFDRVVLDLAGEGTPGWDVEYVDRPADDGSGEAVRVDGDAALQVRLSGMAMPGEGPAEYDGGTIDPEDTEAVEEVVYRFWFEGYTTAFVGVDEAGLPFRVTALEDPTRVVVDVRHPDDD